MIVPPLAIAGGDERHLQRRRRDVFWPIDDCASAAGLLEVGAGNATGRPPAGRSAAVVEAEGLGAADHAGAVPRSTPIWANAVLQDTARMSKSAPPHASPPKLRSGRFVCGGVYEETAG